MTVNKTPHLDKASVHTETGGAHVQTDTSGKVEEVLDITFPELEEDPVFQRHLRDIQYESRKGRTQSNPEIQPTHSLTLADIHARVHDINVAIGTAARMGMITSLLHHLLMIFGIYPDKSTGNPKNLSLLWKGWSTIKGTYLDKIDDRIIGIWEGIHGRKVVIGDHEKIAKRLYEEEVGRELYSFMKLLTGKRPDEKEIRSIVEVKYPDLNQIDTNILKEVFNKFYPQFREIKKEQLEQESLQQQIQGEQVLGNIAEAAVWLQSITPPEETKK